MYLNMSSCLRMTVVVSVAFNENELLLSVRFGESVEEMTSEK